MFDHNYTVNTDNWLQHFYPKIRSKLNISSNSDYEEMVYWNQNGIKQNKLSPMLNLKSQKSIIFGSGPSLVNHENNLQKIINSKLFIISCDGATRWLLQNNRSPNLVISDLDGLDSKIIEYILSNNIMMHVLIHGDNRDKVSNFLDIKQDFNDSTNIWFFTQGKPIENWSNSIGFTDGDRALIFALLNKLNPLLLGFDLNSTLIGEYSKPYFNSNQSMTEHKQKKMDIAKNILNWCSFHYRFYTLDNRYSPGLEIDFPEYMELRL